MSDFPTEGKGYNLRMPASLRIALKHLAADHDQPLSKEILAALQFWVNIGGDISKGSKRGKKLHDREIVG